MVRSFRVFIDYINKVIVIQKLTRVFRLLWGGGGDSLQFTLLFHFSFHHFNVSVSSAKLHYRKNRETIKNCKAHSEDVKAPTKGPNFRQVLEDDDIEGDSEARVIAQLSVLVDAQSSRKFIVIIPTTLNADEPSHCEQLSVCMQPRLKSFYPLDGGA